jgi:hypothetical protein
MKRENENGKERDMEKRKERNINGGKTEGMREEI